jgi:transposase
MSKQANRKYDDEFKCSSVKLYYESGKSYNRLSQDLGIPESTLVGWVLSGKYHNKAIPDQVLDTETLKELNRLRKALKLANEEREILKKALAIFSTEIC